MLETAQLSASRRLAILIDGDNAQPDLIEQTLIEAGTHGLVTIRRIYGDWTTPNMKGWKDALQLHAVQAIQQFRNTTGKNATDSAMIIDAMDILYSGAVHGFCLVSSDSDYTRLATRIREAGLFVMGIGRKDTPRSFVNGCEVFVFAENLSSEVKLAAVGEESAEQVTAGADAASLLEKAVETSLQDDGWAFLGVVGSRLRQLDPSFDPRNYGMGQLSALVRTMPKQFEVKETKTRGGPTLVYIRPKVDSKGQNNAVVRGGSVTE